ncbi:hypothetical protein GOBAR_DD31975 [Gossypium barbadense]|nr:hypothetical protein GOBAR_DD31975 [Gossypium barbadense]
MAVDQVLDLNVSWRDKVLGIGSGYSEKELGVMGSEDKDLDFLEGDVMKSTLNGILSINFSNRIKQILVKEMELTLGSKTESKHNQQNKRETQKCFTNPYPRSALHVRDMGMPKREERGSSKIPLGAGATTMEVSEEEVFGPWMQVERKNRRNNRDRQN